MNSFLAITLVVAAPAVSTVFAQTTTATLKVTTVKGRVFEDVKLLKREGDAIRFMHSGGVQSLKFSDLEEASARMLGYEDYLKEIQALEAAKNREMVEAAMQKEDIHRKRRIELARLRQKPKKTLEEWHDFILLASWERKPDSETPSLLIKESIGKAPNYETSDGGMSWDFICYNPVTETMETMRIGKVQRSMSLPTEIYRWEELAIECGSKSMELSPTVRFGFRLPTEPEQPALQVIDSRIKDTKTQ